MSEELRSREELSRVHLRRARRLLGLTQREVAERLNVDEGTYGAYERRTLVTSDSGSRTPADLPRRNAYFLSAFAARGSRTCKRTSWNTLGCRKRLPSGRKSLQEQDDSPDEQTEPVCERCDCRAQLAPGQCVTFRPGTGIRADGLVP
jgi:hypothetical protein